MSTIASLIVSTRLDTKGLDQGLGQASRSLKGFAGSVSILAASFAAFKVAGFLKGSVDLAARYQTLGVVMGVVGNHAGKTRLEMDALAHSLEVQGISLIESRLNLIRMAQAHLDLSNAGKLGAVAQDAATISNLNSSQTFERVVQGLQTGRTVILRHIGIMVNFQKAYHDAEIQLHRNKSTFSETERANIRLNEVLRAGAIIAGTYQAAMFTAGKQIKSTERYLEDMRVKVGTAFLPSYTIAVFGYANALKFLGNHAKLATDLIVSLTGAVVALAVVLGGSKIAAFFTLLSNPEVAIPVVLAAAAAGLLAHSMATSAEEAQKFADRLEGTPKKILQAQLAIVQADKAKLIALGGNPDAVAPEHSRDFKRLSKLHPGPLTVGDLLRKKILQEKELKAALANQSLNAEPVVEKPESAAAQEAKGALARLAQLRIEAPHFIKAQKAVTAGFLSGGVAAGEYAQHVAKVKEEVDKATKGLFGGDRAEAAKLTTDKAAAEWQGELAKATADANEQRIIDVRTSGDAVNAARFTTASLRDQAIQVEYLNKLEDIRRGLRAGATEDELKRARVQALAAKEVFDNQARLLSATDALAPWKAGLVSLESGFTTFFTDLIDNSASAFSNLKTNARKALGSIVGEFVKQKFEVEILPRLESALGFGKALTEGALAAAAMQVAGDTMAEAAAGMITAADIMAGTTTVQKIKGVDITAAPKISGLQKVAGGLGVAAAGYGIGSLAGSFFSNKVAATGAGALSGAAVGAALGSIVPGIGTAIGAVIGGLAGSLGGFLNRKKATKPLEDVLEKGIKFASTRVESLAKLKDLQKELQSKLLREHDLAKRIEYEERLKEINLALRNATATTNGFSDAMYNIPDIFKVALAAFDARIPDYPGGVPGGGGGGGGGGTGSSGGVGTGGAAGGGTAVTPVTFNISVTATDRSVGQMFDEIEAEARRRALARFGSTAGVGLVTTPTGTF